MGKKNKKQNPVESAGAARQNALNAAKEAEAKANAAAEAAEEAADELTEDIGAAAAEAEELLEETAEALSEQAEESAAEAADEIRAAEQALEDGAELPSEPENEPEKKAPEKKEKKKRELTAEEEAARELNKTKRRKKFKYGTLAAVVTAIVLACVVVVNVICHVLDERYHWNIDLTSSGKYELDPQTIDYLHQVSKDIQIGVMVDEDTLEKDARGFNIIVETLDRFEKESNGHINVEYINMTKRPEAVKQYSKDYDGDFSEGDTVLKCGDLTRVVMFTDMIKTEQTPNYETMTYDYSYTFIGEQSLISAIAGVTDLNQVKVAFISKTGGRPIYYDYDSPSFSTMKELMEKNNYSLTEVDIANDALSPADYDFAVLCAPFNDLTEAQVDKLEEFLKNGGQYDKSLVYFASFYQQDTEKLDAFLDLWGLKAESAVLMEGNEKTAQVAPTVLGNLRGTPVASLTDQELNKGVTESKLPVITPYARPLTLAFTTANNGRETHALLETAKTAFVRPLDVKTEEFNEDTAEKGSFAVAAVATNSVIVDNASHTSRILAFSSPMMLDPNITASKSYLNAGYFISVLNTMSGKESLITVSEKALSSSKITVTNSHVKWIFNIIVLFIPLLVAAIGVVVYIRRRNR